MTAEQFRSQFEDVQLVLTDEQIQLLALENTVLGYPIYRLLDRLILLDADGKYYLTKR